MKKNLNIIILGLAALSLSSCKTLYGKYERPDVKTSGIVRDVASDTDTLAVKDTTTFANIPWRSVFTDPQLQSIIEKGLNNNVNLLNAALNVKMAEEQLKCAKLAFVPSLSFSPQGTIASWDGQAATKTYSLPVTASWMVDLFGNLLSQKRSAQMALLQLKDYQVSVKTNLIANIANMYYTLLMLDKQVELVNNMEGLTKDTWEMMKVLKDTKLGYRGTSVQAAESNYYAVLTQKTDLMRQIRETENPESPHRRPGSFHRPWQVGESESSCNILYRCWHPVAQQPCRCSRSRDESSSVLLWRRDCPQQVLSIYHHLRYRCIHQLCWRRHREPR